MTMRDVPCIVIIKLNVDTDIDVIYLYLYICVNISIKKKKQLCIYNLDMGGVFPADKQLHSPFGNADNQSLFAGQSHI